jgi:hypothetical protein
MTTENEVQPEVLPSKPLIQVNDEVREMTDEEYNAYLISQVLSPEELRNKAKLERQQAVDQIKVTTAAGNTFDGDEVSQGRMARAIMVLSTGFATTVPWVLADNTVVSATAAELTEALALAGAAQAALWVI